MKKLPIYIVFPFLLFTLVACSGKDLQAVDLTSEVPESTSQEEYTLTDHDGEEKLIVNTAQGVIQTEGDVLIIFDKVALTVGEDTSSIAKIYTKLEDWSYTVNAEFGTIMEETDTSFKYVISDGFDQDTIRVVLFDKIQKKQISQIYTVNRINENGKIRYIIN